MTFEELREALIDRLEEGNRGDRGWWLITRVHLTPARLQQIATYLFDAGAAEELALTRRHYRELARILGIETDDPRVVINRHYFLAMETPLRLLERVNSNRWDEIMLTPAGVRLATEEDTVGIFEKILSEIRFCREPWYTASRVAQYNEFDVQPYPAILSVMRHNGGYIDLDEFDLFISRIRANDEVRTASDQVLAFRPLGEGQKQRLRREVESRIPAGSGRDTSKPYNNWRDMGRHTFSLFALGQSATRIRNELFLTEMLAETPETREGDRRRPTTERTETRRAPRPPAARAPTTLRIPETETPDELLTPPSAPQENSGAESELLIGKILAAAGWKVVYYNQRRGYGFDLWAKKGDEAFVIEIKSFLGAATSVTLTGLEYEAAGHHGESYLLVVVENADNEAPIIHVIQDPAESVRFTERSTAQFTAARSQWAPAAVSSFPEGGDRS
jgi:hypothetical protein